jgi:probable rRNA maturation factor
MLLAELLQRAEFELGIYLVGAREITILNETFLRHKGSTDVISFDYTEPSQPEFLHGEIFVCVDEAVVQARRFRTTWQSELARYCVHGVLHLCGYDDQTARARKPMKTAENRLLGELSRRFPVARLAGAKRS